MFDWIERLGSPDNGDGTAELLILLIALSAVLIGLLWRLPAARSWLTRLLAPPRSRRCGG